MLSSRVQNIAASQSLAMSARAKAMRAQGIDVISMSLGEPDMDTPEHIRKAAKDAIDNHWSHYGPVPGIPSLREAIAAWHNSQFPILNSQFSIDDVIVSVGAKMAIYNAIQTLINPGDEVIIPMPSWVSYTEMVKLAEGKLVPVYTTFEDNYCITPEQLRAALTPRTRMIILCSPNNPTGSVYSNAQLEQIFRILQNWPDVFILFDQIYNQLIYTPNDPINDQMVNDQMVNRLIIVNGVSKSYAMTGYRVGWLISKNKEFIAACTRLQSQQLTCATMVAQKAAEAALTGPQDCVDEMRRIFAQRRELICRLAADIPGFRFREPQGAFYLFPDISNVQINVQMVNDQMVNKGDFLAELLLEKAHVAVVSGSAFGEPNCIRLSYAISTDEITEALSRIKEVIIH